MRIRWRRWTARSWIASKCVYQLYDLKLTGRPSDPIWYFAYGSNMHKSAFLERRGMRPLDCRAGKIRGYRLRFNLDGKPKGRAAPANICKDASADVWGVLYQISGWDMLGLNASEGVPGGKYDPLWLMAEDSHGRVLEAMTYIATGNPQDGRPSLRYISLLREGARAHGLPDAWVRFLDSVDPAG